MLRKATRGSGWRKGVLAKLKRSGAVILAPLFLLSLVSSAQAQASPGLDVTVYNNFGYNNAPPLPADSGRPAVGTTTVNSVDQNFDQTPLFSMYEDFIVEYTGYITAPITGSIPFLPTADDGTKLYLDGTLIDNNWRDKGGGGNPTEGQAFTAGVARPFKFWFYENGGGAWVKLYWNIGNGWEVVPESAFTRTSAPQPAMTTTTTVAPYFNAPASLNATSSGTTVTLTWEPGVESNTAPYMWNITWYEMDSGEPSGGWGIWTYANTTTAEITLDSYTSGYGDTRFTVQAGTAPCVGEGQGDCMYGPAATFDITIPVPTTTTTSTTTTSTTTTTTSTTTTTTTTVPTTTTTENTVAPTPQTTSPQTTTTVPVTTTTTTVPPTTTTTTTIPVVEEEKPAPPPASEISQIKTAEKLAELIDAVDLKKIEPDQAVALVTNAAFTELPDDKLEQVFESIPVEELSAEQEEALVSTLTAAPEEVKDTFEATVDIYGSGLDEYVPTGSTIDVGTRRAVIAVTTVMSTVAAAGAAPTASGGTSSPPSGRAPAGGGDGGGSPNAAARKEDEEEQEEAGGLEGPEEQEKNLHTRNSIYKYQENGMKKFSVWGFIKKFVSETAALSFTLAGSAIMFYTLSGDTRKVAIIATVSALVVHYVKVMLENDSD